MNSSSDLAGECFALLDDCDASAADPRSRLYTGHIDTLTCSNALGLPALLEQMQQALQNKCYAVGLFAYELGTQMHDIDTRSAPPWLAQVLLFQHCQRMSATQVEQWLAQREPESRASGVACIQAEVDEQAFASAISRIHAYIQAGDCYQINYTYRLRFDAYGSPLALYRRLRARQPVPYGALVALPDGGAVLSLSPELFVRHANRMATAQPMKGTAAASEDARRNTEIAAALAADSKNRAENLMIVDLLRNDLGRIARFGSVRVPVLFHVDRYSSVLQMTSTVQADLRDDVSLSDVLSALFPCGSITGAPKRRSMQIIEELETDARGLYTGAIGWFDAPQEGSVGDFCMSVPIRTLTLQAPQNGVRKGELGVGAGIVHDSVADEEYAECQLKAAFLTGLPHAFELIETMHATYEQGCRHLRLHLQRLQASAAYFGFSCDLDTLREALQKTCAGLSPGMAFRVRLALNGQGECAIQTAPLMPLQTPVRVLLASEPTEASDLFLRHKTTVRERYDAAWRAAEAQGAFDMLFCNERGELTEGARSNIFVKIDGRWYTPPLSAGLLPGVMRAVLLADPEWQAQERCLTPDMLQQAQEIVVCNALRGVLPATLG